MRPGSTLDQFLEQHMAGLPGENTDLRKLLAHVAKACIELSGLVRQQALPLRRWTTITRYQKS